MSKGGKGKGRHYSANDMRSMTKNPNSSHFKAATDNRANQLNPQHPTHDSSRSGEEPPARGGGFPSTDSRFRGYGSEDMLNRMGVTIGITPGDISLHEIETNREAAIKGERGGVIGEVETRLLRMSKAQLRELIQKMVSWVPGRTLQTDVGVNDLDADGLRDLVWGIIHQDFLDTNQGYIDRYLDDTWIPRFLSGNPSLPTG